MPEPAKELPPRDWKVSRQIDVAQFFGRSLDTVKNWAKQEMPGRPGAYDLSAIAVWLLDRRSLATGDELEEGPDSPGLERLRLAKAELAELDLEERRGTLLSRDKAREVFGRWATILRRLGERFAKQHPKAAKALTNALAECDRILDELTVDDDSVDRDPA